MGGVQQCNDMFIECLNIVSSRHRNFLLGSMNSHRRSEKLKEDLGLEVLAQKTIRPRIRDKLEVQVEGKTGSLGVHLFKNNDTQSKIIISC